MKIEIKRCYECGSTNVFPCYDAEEDIYGLMSCEDCEVLNDEERFKVQVDEQMQGIIFNLATKVDEHISLIINKMNEKGYCFEIPNGWIEELDEADNEKTIGEKCARILFRGGEIIFESNNKITLSLIRKIWMKMLDKMPLESLAIEVENVRYMAIDAFNLGFITKGEKIM